MRNIYLLSFVLLLTQTQSQAQLSAAASTSTTVDIIAPVGTENNGELISGVFLPGKEAGFIEFINKGKVLNCNTGFVKAETPSFRIAGGQFAYAITFTYDPFIINRNAMNEIIPVESLSLLPVYEKDAEQIATDKFSIGAKFRVGPSPIPGNYFSNNPYRVTVHFN